MPRSGTISLGDFTLTTPATYVGDWVEDFSDLLAMTVQFRFAYGSGGTNARCYLQTSLDQATTPVDLASVVFGVASEVAVLNFSGLTPKTTQYTPTDGALADDTTIDGLFGDRFRVKIVVSGTYAGSTVLSVRAHPR